jgi:peptidase, S24 family
MTRIERVRKLIDEKFNGNQADFSRAIGKAPAQVNQWLNGYRNIGDGVALNIEKSLGLPQGYLDGVVTNQLPKENEIVGIHRPMLWSSNDPLPEDDYTFAPYMKEQAFCGGAGSFEIPDYNGFRLPFGKATLRRKSISPDNVFCCTLTGDSMEERIAEDAAIAVDAGEKTIRDGKIYAFRHGDLFRVKYLSRLPGGRVKIKSHNPAYDDEEAGLEDIEVIGRVFWWSVLD